MIAAILIGFIIQLTYAITLYPESDSIRAFKFSDNFEEQIKGQLTNYRYDLSTNAPEASHINLMEKLWIAIHRLDDTSLHRVTAVRLDNMLDRFDQDVDHAHFGMVCHWREFVGWPVEMTMNIADHPDKLSIPANLDYDVLQFDVKGLSLPLAQVPDHGFPRVLFQVPGNQKGVRFPITDKTMALTRVMSPGWTRRYVTVDEFPKIYQLWDPTGTLQRTSDAFRPVPYKVDMFRYLVLYIYGGVYMDNKLVLRAPLDELLPINKDMMNFEDVKDLCANSWMAYRKGSPFLKAVIAQVIRNARERYYGGNPLCITGPCLLSELFFNKLTDDQRNQIAISYKANPRMLHYCDGRQYPVVNFHNGEYRRRFPIRGAHYDILWASRQVYN